MGWKKVTALFSRHRGGIRRRLLWIGLFFLAFALLTNTVAGTLYTRAQIKKAAAELQTEVAFRVASEIEDFMGRKVERLLDLSTSASLHQLGSQEQRMLALLLLKNDNSFTEISILNDRGREVLRVSQRRVYLAPERFDQSKTEKFKRAMAGERYISQVYTSDKAEPYVSMAIPVKIGPKQAIGVVSGEVHLGSLWHIIGAVRFGAAGYAYLVDRQGNLIAHQDPSLVLKRTNLSQLRKVQAFLRNPKMADAAPAQEEKGITAQAVLSTFAPIRSLGWAVVLEEPVAAALDELNTLVHFALLLLLAGLLVGAIILLGVSNKMTRPILELHRGAEVIGSGNLDYRVEIKTGDEIEQLAEGFNKMAAELQASYSTLEQKVEQRTRELSALHAVAAASQSLELDVALNEAIAKVLEILSFDAARIFLVDPSSQELKLKCHKGIDEELSQMPPYRIGEGVIGKVGETGRPLVFEDIQTDPGFAQQARRKVAFNLGFHASVFFPIKAKDRILGVLNLLKRAPHHFTPEELRLVGSMVNQIGVAVENAILFEEVKQTSQGLEALIRINRDVAELLERHILLPRIAEEAKRILGVDGVSFRLVEGDHMVRAGYAGGEELLDFHPKIKIGESITGRVIAENRIIAIKNILEEQTMIPEHQEILRRAGYRSFLGIPLRVGERVIGSINFYSKGEREFRPEEVRVVAAFADQAAIAVENANLFAEVKSKSIELEETNLELRAASRAKSDFLAAMSHELRTPLNVIIGNADIIKDGYLGEVTKKQKESLEKVLRYSHMLLKLINNVLSLSRMEAKKMSLDLSTFHVREVIGHAKTFTEQLNGNRRLEFLWQVEPDLPPITTDAMKLEEILQNLIGNAFKFTPKGRIEVRVRDLPGKKRLEFAVADTGIGIDKKDLEKIFEQFQQLKDAHTGNFSGVGLGLSIVKNYLELMRGDIQVESQPGVGSIFTFTLPYSIEPLSS